MTLKIFIPILILGLTFISCKENNPKEIGENLYKSPILIEVSSDTIEVNKYVRGMISLKKPYFSEKESKIVVVLEADENVQLKEDLSNEFQIGIEVFQNLNVDSMNKKLFDENEYEFNQSALFEKKFDKTGNKIIRGYVLEYLTEKPPLDSIFPKEKVHKHYFEKEIYVFETNYN
ncbi:hypothetical protein [Xanthomarina gelatinilytica]|uniref:hypothetical protein n=1 Tax=Xanthomarina gelatinilytica TaxID=1137281 RepID=UPI003AA867F6